MGALVSMSMMPARITMLLVVSLLSVGCGAPKPRPETETPVIEMEPMVVEVSESDGQRVVRAFDAQSLFETGKAAIESEKYDVCVDAFGELLKRFPDSRYAHSALYNRGLCYESLRQHGMAAVHFQRYKDLAKTPKDLRDGEFRWGFNLVESGGYSEGIVLYDRLLTLDGLGEFDRAECYIRRGVARLRLLNYSEAERDFERGLKVVEAATEGVVMGNDLAAEAHYRRGETYFELNKNVILKLPLKRMKTDLAAKTRFFRQAQASFIDSLNVRDPYWATAAGLQLGALYEQFYLDILRAEFPDDFDEDTRQVYFLELKKYLQPLLKQSVSIYERSITMSARLSTSNHWVAETQQRLNKLRSLIEENARAIKALDAAAASPPVRTRPKRRTRRAKGPGG